MCPFHRQRAANSLRLTSRCWGQIEIRSACLLIYRYVKSLDLVLILFFFYYCSFFFFLPCLTTPDIYTDMCAHISILLRVRVYSYACVFKNSWTLIYRAYVTIDERSKDTGQGSRKDYLRLVLVTNRDTLPRK